MRERDKYKGRVEENSSMFSSQGDWEEGGLFSETRSAQSLQSTFHPQEASGTDLVGVTDDLYIQ